MAAVYPGALPELPEPSSSTTMDASGYEHDLVHVELAQELTAVATELGTDPAGAQATVKDRLDEAAIGVLQADLLWTTASTYTSNIRSSTATLNTAGGVGDTVHYLPWWCPASATLDRIAVQVTTAADSAHATLGLYGTTTGGYPGAKIANFGEIDCSTTGTKELTISQAVSGGKLYWLALHNELVTVVYNIGAQAGYVGLSVSATASILRGIRLSEVVTYTSTSMPANAASSPTIGTTNVYAFWLRRS